MRRTVWVSGHQFDMQEQISLTGRFQCGSEGFEPICLRKMTDKTKTTRIQPDGPGRYIQLQFRRSVGSKWQQLISDVNR